MKDVPPFPGACQSLLSPDHTDYHLLILPLSDLGPGLLVLLVLVALVMSTVFATKSLPFKLLVKEVISSYSVAGASWFPGQSYPIGSVLSTVYNKSTCVGSFNVASPVLSQPAMANRYHAVANHEFSS